MLMPGGLDLSVEGSAVEPRREVLLVNDNPVFEGYFADPYAWRAGKWYYAVGTAPGVPPQASQPSVFPVLRSRDLLSWEKLGYALVPPSPEFGSDLWAPEVVESDQRFFMYYSVGFGDRAHHIRVAVAERPEGPYLDNGEPLTRPESCPFAIDAHAFRDDDGQWYLFHARDFLEKDAGGEAGTGLVVDRLIDMRRLAGDLHVVVRPRHPWQLFQAQRPIYDRILDWHTLEGPTVVKHEGRYYCFFSGGCWQNESYGVDFAVADHPMGPWKYEGGEQGARVLRTIPGKLIGPGHNSTVAGPDGRIWIVYHAWDQAHTARQLHVDPLEWTLDGPRRSTRG